MITYSSLRKSAKRKKRIVKALKKPKRNNKLPKKKQINQWTVSSKSFQLMDETIRLISEQFRNMEIKIAIEQFMANQLIDQLQKKGFLNEQEIKSIYLNTNRFWKNDLRGEGDPFRDINLDEMPILQYYRKRQQELKLKAGEGLQGRLPPAQESDRNNPVYNSSENRELKKFITHLKEEARGLKKEMIKQKMQDLKQFMTTKDTD